MYFYDLVPNLDYKLSHKFSLHDLYENNFVWNLNFCDN